MDVKVEKKSGNVCVIDIELDEKRANTEYEKACRKIAQKVNIAGFRRGKAPRAKIEGAVGVETIKNDAIETIVKEVCSKVIKDEKLDIISEPKLTTNDYSLEKPSKLTIEFELRPEVKLPQYKGITLEVEKFTTAPDALEKQIQSLFRNKRKNPFTPTRNIITKLIIIMIQIILIILQ